MLADARVKARTLHDAVLEGRDPLTVANTDAVRRALEAAGIEFIPENGGGAGVRLRRKAGESA
jgi:hypothetical protein